MKKNIILFSSLAIILSGCTYTVDPKISMEPPVYVEQLPPKQVGNEIQHAGSLFGRGENPIFSDRKAMNVNDLVTVVISEKTNQSSNGKKTTSKNSTTALSGGIITAGSPLSSVTDQINKFGNIGFKGGSETAYSGDGTNTRTEAFNTTISARIVKVLNNGNYFIEGNRELLINGEKQIIQLSGVIRPYDISSNNEIDSRYIADAKISYKTEGDINKAITKPWGTKLLEGIWPF
ncbi:flagellar basal body L-ring protein [Campylobacter sputorum subsp. bubulus]|uniref:Flagellar L-ring protein n=1 Tax=Campylobacter sputorum subsp. sputorum TaxID=32024 RepID=A0A381DHZ7_9BACT|nr:flagellar basal body L-ring protein FlgH [Campylobacter sputorum]ASM35367.1 flagellar L-ring protein [Campylobacter sputorum aubsp. sputorum RM3237]KAB0582888.1 flagellar basal body L-ring protein FlgH [Campylobacter sputorum subsp. sputorum]QEL05559.1 flagellar outer membrane L-ring protein FlgH [Campylobacter sputorum subsp. sputorum]SUX08621.1 flagellar basal body L-ring protein [Campylobacter sputorum subsp. bubulus]SUX10323.1 flagellar basal body L-ring protein [Campylobacter sputorum 